MNRTEGRFISYAGNHEDVLLNRVFRSQSIGFYIDVGAHDPVYGSVTKVLSDRGWTGINIEPNPRAIARFREHRPRDVNLTAAVGSRPGQCVFFDVPDQSQLSTLSMDTAVLYKSDGQRIVEHRVETITLASVCEQYVDDREIDLLSIDTEGAEQDVLLGADFARWRPKVLLIEATRPQTNILNHESWEPIVLDANYLLCLFDGVNRVYVRSESAELIPILSYPVNCLDNFRSIWQHDAEQKAEQYMAYGRPGRAAAWLIMKMCHCINRLIRRRVD